MTLGVTLSSTLSTSACARKIAAYCRLSANRLSNPKPSISATSPASPCPHGLALSGLRQLIHTNGGAASPIRLRVVVTDHALYVLFTIGKSAHLIQHRLGGFLQFRIVSCFRLGNLLFQDAFPPCGILMCFEILNRFDQTTIAAELPFEKTL